MATPALSAAASPPACRRRLIDRLAPLAARPAAVAALSVLLAAGGSTIVLAIGGGAVGRVEWSRAADQLAPAPPVDRATVRRLARLRPRGVIVVVDSARGRLRVERDGVVLRDAVCSAGSGTVLREPAGGRVWVFDTPLGERGVIGKTRNPVWTKPDWAFIEEGMEPPTSWRERVDDVSLGDYSLSLGDGYLIHGTLFQTLLGQPVTHGCIRLGDEDLEYVWRTVPVGARVYLY